MKLSKKYEYLKFLQHFDEKSYNNSDILFSIKQYQPLLKELFTEQDDSIYIKPVDNIEELKSDNQLKNVELIHNCHTAIKITNYNDKGIYLLFDNKFYISYIFYELTNNGLKVVNTKPYYNLYNCEKLLNCFIFYIYEGTI